MFTLKEAYSGATFTDKEGNEVYFADGKEAAAKATELNDSSWVNVKWQPRRAPNGTDENWKAREQAKLDSGEYTKVPPFLTEFMLPEHFVHVSKTRDVALAYTADETRGKANVQTRINLASYLKKFRPELSSQKITGLVGQFERHNATQELKWAISADEIVSVYTNFNRDTSGVAESCMRYPEDNWTRGGGIHPCRVYGNSDLRLAYLTDSHDKTISRAMVWEDEKIYSRVYGQGKIHDALRALGYAKSEGYYGSNGKPGTNFYGAKVHAIPSKRDSSFGYVMPYVDECSRATLSRDGKWFTFDEEGDADCHSTGGVTGRLENAWFTCEHCHEELRANDHYSQSVITGYRRPDEWGTRRTQTWCDSCVNEDAISTPQGVVEAESVPTIEVDGRVLPEAYARATGNLHDCPHCQTLTLQNNYISQTADGSVSESWCNACAIRDSFVDNTTGGYYNRSLAAPESLAGARPGRMAHGRLQPAQGELPLAESVSLSPLELAQQASQMAQAQMSNSFYSPYATSTSGTLIPSTAWIPTTGSTRRDR